MKKTFFLAIAAICGVAVQAQLTTSFGIKGGVNANTFYLKSEGTGSDTRYSLTKPGFHVGALADLQFSGNVSVQPQLLFAMKGGKIKISGSESDFNFYTIDLPVNVLYHYNGFFIGAGPNLSYGVSGKLDQTGQPEKDLYEDGALGVGTKFERFEVGTNGVLGFRFPSGFMVSTNYSHGFTDILDEAASSTGEIKSHNSFWGFSIGYMFGSSGTAKKK